MWGEGVPLGHLWVQAWTNNAYLNLRALLRALFYIISSSRRSPEELFSRSGNSPASVCPSNSPSISISCYRISSNTTGRIFLNFVRMFPSVSSCASTKKNSGPSTNMADGDKHGRRRPCLMFLVIASLQKLLDGFEWNLPIDRLVIASPPRPLVGFI